MDERTAAVALRAMAPRLMGTPTDALAAAAASAWNAHRDGTIMQVPAIRAVVDVAWRPGYRAGVQRGQQVTCAFLATAILRRAEPAQPGMTGFHRLVANWLHAARVEPESLRDYLTRAGWQQTATKPGADVFAREARQHGTPHQPEITVPQARREDHELAVLTAATLLAGLEQREVAQVLEDLAPTQPARAPMSPQALDLLRVAYQATKEATLAAPTVLDQGPHHNDYRVALGDWTDDTEAGRLAAAVRVGYVHGFRAGHSDARWSVAGRMLNAVDNLVPEHIQRAVLIDGRSGFDWLRAAEVDARWAAEADMLGRVSNPGYHSPPGAAPLISFPAAAHSTSHAAAATTNRAPAAGLAFGPLRVDPTGQNATSASGHLPDAPHRRPPTPRNVR